MPAQKKFSLVNVFPSVIIGCDFSPPLSEEHTHQTETSLKDTLKVDTLAGKRLLDIGSGSGLFSTGDMWMALENVSALVAEQGKLFIAIYNDHGGTMSNRARAAWTLGATSWTGLVVTHLRWPGPNRFTIFFKTKGFRLEKLKSCAGRLGCNEFVSEKDSSGV